MDEKFERVALDTLRLGRRGKHNELMGRLLTELSALPDGEAIKVPLEDIKGVSLANLRAAVARATSSHGLKIATYSDANNFYLWKRTKRTARYERNVTRADVE
jgi:hypothetical protein